MVLTEFGAEQAYQRLALDDPDGRWELHDGQPREKPATSYDHDALSFLLGHFLQSQLRLDEFRVLVNGGRLRRSAKNYYIPDVVVVPAEMAKPLRGCHQLAVFPAPMPLVVEVWSLSTGGYDVDAKLPEYQRRGDLEIWRLHPYDRTLTAWRRQPDGSYAETVYRGGLVQPIALPNVTIDLDALFET